MTSFKEFYNSVLDTSYADLPYPVKKACFKKGDIITAYGQIEETLYFINTGIIEMTVQSYMTEKVIDFFFEGEVLCACTSFLTQIPSDVQTTALADTEVETIKRADWIKANDTSFDASRFGRILTEHNYIRKSNREKDLLTKTVETRYAEMFSSRPHYISNLPVNKIAKYLGVHPESLSRIRKKVNS